MRNMLSELRLPNRKMLDNLIAEKATRGYMIELTTLSGDRYVGFVSGYSDDQIQLIVIGNLDAPRGNVKHEFNAHSIKDRDNIDTDYLQWVFIEQIEAVSENRFRLDHLDEYSRAKIKKSSFRTVQRAQAYLDQQQRTK
jgi:hypothetical protein